VYLDIFFWNFLSFLAHNKEIEVDKNQAQRRSCRVSLGKTSFLRRFISKTKGLRENDIWGAENITPLSKSSRPL